MFNNSGFYCSTIREGNTTIFVDVNEAKTGSKYISISASRLLPGNARERSTVRFFGSMAMQLSGAIGEAMRRGETMENEEWRMKNEKQEPRRGDPFVDQIVSTIFAGSSVGAAC